MSLYLWAPDSQGIWWLAWDVGVACDPNMDCSSEGDSGGFVISLTRRCVPQRARE